MVPVLQPAPPPRRIMRCGPKVWKLKEFLPHARGPRVLLCGYVFHSVSLCSVTLLAIQSCRSCIPFKLFYSPFPETFVHIVFLINGIF